MPEIRHEIRNSRGERIFDVIRSDKTILLETSHKGKVCRIPLVEELRQIFNVLDRRERIWLLNQLNSLFRTNK